MAWGHFYTSKRPVTAVHVLNNRVLPFFEVWNQLRMLVDRGSRSQLAVDPRSAASSTVRSLTPILSSDHLHTMD